PIPAVCLCLLARHTSTVLLFFLLFFFHAAQTFRYLHSFPTRRSSDLRSGNNGARPAPAAFFPFQLGKATRRFLSKRCTSHRGRLDRKSTRLNSSHGSISYAVFCLKKKMAGS